MRRLADFVVRWPLVVIALWAAIAVALKSVTRYMEAMKSVCVRVADSGHWGRVA